MLKQFSLVLLTSTLAGCAVGPDYLRPVEAVPTQWPKPISQSVNAQVDWVQWWTRYKDPALDRLVAEALSNNLDTGIAAARVREARAILGYSEAERYPTLSAQLDMSRGDANGGLASSDDGTSNSYRIAGVLSYEVDLWGRLARSTEAARAQLLEASFAAEAIRLGLVTDVVTGYFDLRALQQQIRTTKSTIETRRRALFLQQSRFRNGAVPALTLDQTEAELARVEAQLPLLVRQAEQRERTLAVLAGRSADAITTPMMADGELSGISFSTELAQRLPSELLERRPDIRAAEAGLTAANARIGVARAAQFPRLDLAATAGSGALDAGDLFSGPAALWQVGASVLAPVLDFGRRRADVDTAAARRDIAELQYRATVRNAFREVGDAWTLLATANTRLEALNRQVAALDASVIQAERRYANGYSPFLELLDARRALFDAQLSQADAVRDRLMATAVLFKSMGGGWEG